MNLFKNTFKKSHRREKNEIKKTNRGRFCRELQAHASSSLYKEPLNFLALSRVATRKNL